MTGRSLLRLAALAVSFAATSAQADPTKDQCIDSNGHAQALRRAGRFAEAREQLRICGDTACPRIVRDDCVRRLDELDRTQPTIVFEAKDGAGRDLAAVQVSVDGRPLAERLDGSALAVDPGEHTFTFAIAGQPPTTATYVVNEGEKSRREVVVLGPAVPPPAEVAPGPAPMVVPSSPPSSAHNSEKVLGLVVGAVGVVGVGLGSFFGIEAISKNHTAACNAGNVCADPQARIDAIHAGNTSTIAFAAGGVLLAGGIALEIVAARGSSPSPAARLELAPWVGPGGAGTTLAGAW